MPDDEVFGLEPLELGPRRREAQQEVHAGASSPRKNPLVPSASATTSVRFSPHHRALSRQRGFARTVTASKGVPDRVRRDEVGHAELGRELCAVPVVAIQELDYRLRIPSSRARASAAAWRTGSTSHTRPPAASACDVRVIAGPRATRSLRRGRRRSGFPPADPMRRRHRPVAPAPDTDLPNLPQGHCRVPGATLATLM